ncbi:hypothetical protein J1N35_034128 [Gossypium stocksii]|uniref:Transmembrane protein n=1 Tax=Gossypium stocksii TaxID=47602 RepID=A0A9D3ZPX5_9ROSI|nr:hypothetical protein J1N35_034128 [Gossypium stocksii]
MIYKNVVEEDEDDSSPPPLLKHLLKDFGGGPTHFDNDDNAGDFETMIVKFDHRRNIHGQSLYFFKPLVVAVASLMRARRDGLDIDDDEEEDEEGFGKFVVRSTVRSVREGAVVNVGTCGEKRKWKKVFWSWGWADYKIFDVKVGILFALIMLNLTLVALPCRLKGLFY